MVCKFLRISVFVGITAVVFFLGCPYSSAQSAYTSSDQHDPFDRQLPKKPKLVGLQQPKDEIVPPALVVQSLVCGGPVPTAIIDGKIFKVGEKVKEAIVNKITKEGVEVLYQGETFLYPAPSKRLMGDKGSPAAVKPAEKVK